ncbi:MAG TPA: agglutinin biogenesis protein MshP [Burkholderiales bacterium]|nr:agglutinin biogenesis protein MshP [Burkholderiales bacterium]
MCPERGFATVTVIALLAMLAIFGVALVVISTGQQVGATLDVQGVRAYHAARGGLEWGMAHILRPGGGCVGIHGRTLVYGDNLAGFRVTLGCTSTVHREAGTDLNIFQVTATACNDNACPTAIVPPPLGYVQRQLRVTLGDS